MLAFALLGVLAPTVGPATTAPASATPTAVSVRSADVQVVLVLFHGEGCPHCAAEREFLAGLSQRYPALAIEQYEVWNDEANRQLLMETADRMGFEAAGVPVTIVGEQVWVGFSEAIATEIEAAVDSALAGASPPTEPSNTTVVDVPLIGSVDISSTSLVVATLVIGFVDGVNPCSLWVLSVLLAIVLHSGSRRRVLLVGATFLVVTAAMYALYIVGFYSALDLIGSAWWIRLIIAAIAISFGVLQLKDGLRPGRGPSLSIPAERKPGLYARMRAVARPDRSIAATLVGTVVLAVGVSLLETPCTAGLPLLWTSMVADADLSRAEAAALFALYMLVFLLDELAVFVVAVVAMRATKVQERHGRILKLLAGSVLTTLGVAMLLAPEAMNSVAGTVAVFACAGVLALALTLLTRRTTAR